MSSITILDCIFWIKDAWNDVTEETIYNCFRKSGFESIVSEDNIGEIDDDEEFNELTQNLINSLPDSISVDEYLSCDSMIPTCDVGSEAWEQDFLNSLSEETEETIESNSDNEAEDICVVESLESQSKISHNEAMNYLSKIKSYALTNDDLCLYESLLKSEYILQSNIVKINKRQTKITDYIMKS